MMRGIATTVVGLSLVLAVAGCGQPNTSPTPSGSATTGNTGSPTPTTSPEPQATLLPPDCLTLVSQADAATFGAHPLNDPVYTDLGPSGVKVPTVPAADAVPLQIARELSELSCLWMDANADITHLSVEVGHISADAAAALTATLQSDGYACESANGGTQCSITTPNSQYPVDDNFTYLFRDDIIILVDQSNFPTNNLMGSMAAEIWF